MLKTQLTRQEVPGIVNTIDVGKDEFRGKTNFQSSRFERVCDNGIRRRDGCSDHVRCKKPCCEDGEDAQGGIMVMVMTSRIHQVYDLMREREGIMMMVLVLVMMMV